MLIYLKVQERPWRVTRTPSRHAVVPKSVCVTFLTYVTVITIRTGNVGNVGITVIYLL
jgi:hypothetical protein